MALSPSEPQPSSSSLRRLRAVHPAARLSALEIAAKNGLGPMSSLGSVVWHGQATPCVSCGELVQRDAGRCNHCGQDLSAAMLDRMASSAGPWYVHEHVRPFPGVTLERLVRQIQRGVLTATTIVRGPTTHHQWRFAAETPGLSKHLGLCWSCQQHVQVDDTYCGHCDTHLDRLPGQLPDPLPVPVIAPDHLDQLQQAVEAAASAARSVDPPMTAPAHVDEALAFDAPAAMAIEPAAPARDEPIAPPSSSEWEPESGPAPATEFSDAQLMEMLDSGDAIGQNEVVDAELEVDIAVEIETPTPKRRQPRRLPVRMIISAVVVTLVLGLITMVQIRESRRAELHRALQARTRTTVTSPATTNTKRTDRRTGELADPGSQVSSPPPAVAPAPPTGG